MKTDHFNKKKIYSNTSIISFIVVGNVLFLSGIFIEKENLSVTIFREDTHH